MTWTEVALGFALFGLGANLLTFGVWRARGLTDHWYSACGLLVGGSALLAHAARQTEHWVIWGILVAGAILPALAISMKAVDSARTWAHRLHGGHVPRPTRPWSRIPAGILRTAATLAPATTHRWVAHGLTVPSWQLGTWSGLAAVLAWAEWHGWSWVIQVLAAAVSLGTTGLLGLKVRDRWRTWKYRAAKER